MTTTYNLSLMLGHRVKIKPNGCWEWGGQTSYNGYPQFHALGKTRRPHREVLRSVYGILEHDAHHLCENRLCINPSHLVEVKKSLHGRLVPSVVSKANKSKNFCVNGHEFTPENTYVYFTNVAHRACRSCYRERSYKRYWREKIKKQFQVVA
jgi:hypothetical protein